MRPVNDPVIAIFRQNDVGRNEIAVAELCMALHAVQSLLQLIECARIKICESLDFFRSLIDRIAETVCLEPVDLELNVDELIKPLFHALRLILHALLKGLSGNKFRSDRPLAVDLLDPEDLSSLYAIGLNISRDQGFIENTRLRMSLGKDLDDRVIGLVDSFILTF